MAGRRLVAAAVGALAVLTTAPAARARDFAPLDRPGPPIHRHADVTCTANVAHATREPVLLNPATGVTVEQNFSWNYERAFDALGIPWCAYHAPSHTLGDIQTSGELLVNAIRRVHALAGRRIAVMGHSQGGMSMRWPLRFWPRTRAMVDDVIGMAGSNHGTTQERRGQCSPGCPAADWQQAADANFIRALNSRAETFPGISYSEIYTHTDEVVQPNSGPAHSSSSLHGGGGRITNVATQDICPADVEEHNLIGTNDPVAYALAIDALTHAGPADPARIPRTVCLQAHQPGVDPASLDTYLQPLEGAPGVLSVPIPGVQFVGQETVTKSEPPLRCYVYAGVRVRRRAVVHVPHRWHHVRARLNGHRVRVRHHRVVAHLRHGHDTLRIHGRRHGHRVHRVRRWQVC
jgi:triacylglycerol esterase/lipase EstA (alpha/beta hydrolase family)